MCTYQAANKLLVKEDFVGALSIAGPILEGNSGDLAVWQANFGPGGASEAASSAVPEPTTSALVVLLLAAFGLGQVCRKVK